MNKKEAASLLFVPLGGVGEIGMNLALYGYGPPDDRQWIIVDMGVSFAGIEDGGADLIIPDIAFLEREERRIKAVIITHAHEDHYGAVLFLAKRFNWPIYCTKFTAHLLEAKSDKDKISKLLRLNIFRAGDEFTIGPFHIETIQVNHSIPEAVSLAVTTDHGTLVHTGDWKIDPRPALNDPTDIAYFTELGERGVLGLICDSTNAMHEGKGYSESDVEASLRQLIKQQEGRVAVTTFASNIGRIRSIALAAQEAGRSVFLQGRSMLRMVNIATELGYMRGLPEFLPIEAYAATPRNQVVLILTGSQGEQRAALAKIAKGSDNVPNLTPGDSVIYSSRTIPGNERAIFDTQNRLADRGINIISDHDALVHVSGHPYRAELAKLYEILKPQILIPVHGEALHLNAHAKFARQCGISEVLSIRNGDMVRFAPGGAQIIEKIPIGKLYKDGKLIGYSENLAIDQRRKLNHVGHIAICLNLTAKDRKLKEVQLTGFGIPLFDSNGHKIEDLLRDLIKSSLDVFLKAKNKTESAIISHCKSLVAREMENIWGKKPVISIFIS